MVDALEETDEIANLIHRLQREQQEATPKSSLDTLVESLGGGIGKCGVLTLCEAEKPPPELMVNSSDEWVDVEFEVALDSGATDNVCHAGDVPGYIMEQSPGSKAGQGFIVGNGSRVPNDGQVHLSLQTGGTVANGITSTF